MHFISQIAPYLTLLINGVGWVGGFPRLMTNRQTISALETVKNLQHQINVTSSGDSAHIQRDAMKGRCQSFADISCDIEVRMPIS